MQKFDSVTSGPRPVAKELFPMRIEDIGERQIKAPARALMIGRDDNVAVLLRDVKAGEAILLNSMRVEIAAEDLPAGNKIATMPLAVGQPVINCGQVIGTAIRFIQPGERVHYHNLSVA
jgi:hypothetical protein